MSRLGSMDRWLWARFVVLLLVVAACSNTSADERGAESEPPEPPSSSVPPLEPSPDPSEPPPTLPGGPAGSEALLELTGRLAITDGAVLSLADPAGGNLEVIDRASDGQVSQPTWSPDGALLAWSRFEDGAGTLETLAIEEDERRTVATGSTSAIYLQWNGDASQIGMLQNHSDGIAMSASAIDGPTDLIGVGAPFYFSWAPDNASLALHVGDELEVTDRSQRESLVNTSTTFTAPAWVDQETLVAARVGALLLVDVGSGLASEVADLDTSTQFVLNPDARRVAYLAPGDGIRTIQAQQPPASATLRVLDLQSGDDSLVTPEQALAWEWSPDGSRLAYLGRSEFNRDRLRWYFWEDGLTIGASSEHLPSQVAGQLYLPFFAQYAQSHTRWSPTGAAFAFAGVVADEPGVWVHVLGETPQSVRVASGDFVTWSPDSVTSGGGVSPL